MRYVVAWLILALGVAVLHSVSPPDPFILNDTIAVSGGFPPYRKTSDLSLRSQDFSPSDSTLVLIGAGQSLATSITPTLYTPTNSTAIDQFNIYDGACYSIGGPLLGTQYNGSLGSSGPGNVLARVADKLVTNGRFDRVIIVPIAIGGTLAADWATDTLSDRIPVAMRRLISRGFVPGSTGLTFAISWWHGENDNGSGTSSASYQASIATILSNAQAAGFSGRMFVNKETWLTGATSATIQAAQAAVVNGTTIFAGGDIDSLDGTNRFDNTHLNDTGAAAAATLVEAAMHASGSPY